MKTINTASGTLTINPFETKKGQPHIIETFSSMGSLVSAMQDYNKTQEGGEELKRRFSDASFVGNETFRDTCRDCVLGKAELGKEAETLARRVDGLVMDTVKKQRIKTVAGGRANVAAYLAGSPKPMRRRKLVPSETAPLEIIVNCSSSGAISADEMQKRGVAIAALVKKIAANRPVNLRLAVTLKPSTAKYSYIGLVSFPTNPVDTNRLAYCLSSQGFARGIGFALSSFGDYATEKALNGTATMQSGSNYVQWPFEDFSYIGATATGEYTTAKRTIGNDLRDYFKTDMLYIPGAFSGSSDYEGIKNDAVAWINSKVKEFVKKGGE